MKNIANFCFLKEASAEDKILLGRQLRQQIENLVNDFAKKHGFTTKETYLNKHTYTAKGKDSKLVEKTIVTIGTGFVFEE